MARRSAGEFDRRISIWNAGLIDDGTATVQGPLAEVGKRWAKKVDELKALAIKEEIDLGDATKKDDIIAAIELAREAKDA